MTNYEGFESDNQLEHDLIDPSILDQMIQMRDNYELAAAEASAMHIVHGEFSPQMDAAITDGIQFYVDAANITSPQEARAMLHVFAGGIESSRAFAVAQAPFFISQELISYDEGIRYMIDGVEDKSPNVADAACRSLFTHQEPLREAVQSSSDELAPRRLERILEVITAIPPTTPDGDGSGGGSRRHLSIA
jgi:hypothetical protein